MTNLDRPFWRNLICCSLLRTRVLRVLTKTFLLGLLWPSRVHCICLIMSEGPYVHLLSVFNPPSTPPGSCRYNLPFSLETFFPPCTVCSSDPGSLGLLCSGLDQFHSSLCSGPQPVPTLLPFPWGVLSPACCPLPSACTSVPGHMPSIPKGEVRELTAEEAS